MDTLLRAAAVHERQEPRILTPVVGSGSHGAQVEMHELAAQLGPRRTSFLGPRPQQDLAVVFNCADVCCSPSDREPFGLGPIECRACGTPVIGADSGSSRDCVTPEIWALVSDTEERDASVRSRTAAVDRALTEDRKQTRGRHRR